MFDFIKLNPLIKNIVIDGNSCSNIVDQYENNKLLIFPEFKFDMDLSFLQSFRFHKNKSKTFKKAKFDNLLLPTSEQSLAFCKNDKNKALKLSKDIAKILNLATELVIKLFPNYKIIKNNCTIRCSETTDRDLHLDSYGGQENEQHAVRLFYNLDNELPRHWKISHIAPILYKMFKLNLKEHPNLINKQVNNEIIKLNNNLPKHEIFFPPNCLWLGNSQVISHEVYYGRQMLAFTFFIESTSMNNFTKCFSNILNWENNYDNS